MKPILVLDSGIGGLSVLRPIRALLPDAPFLYVADNAGYPYGTREPHEIEARVPALLGRLAERFDPELIVIACNTASTIALGGVRAALDIPVVGTVPAIKPAAALSRTRTIGVLGTPATVVQPYVDRLAQQFAADCTVFRHGSAELVDLAEKKLKGEDVSPDAVEEAVWPLIEPDGAEDIDTVVLACTHFPLLRDELQGAIPQPVLLVDGSDGIARRTAHLLRGRDWGGATLEGRALFTRRDDSWRAYAPGLAAYGLTRVGTL